jgi:uncharacterized protein (DUF302 family)
MTSYEPDTARSTPAQVFPPAYGFGTTIAAPFDEVMARVTEALQAEGFGVLTTIDVQATLHAKLNIDFERYAILGACNPQLAYRALEIEHEIGLLLPCNVVVHDAHEAGAAPRTRVEIADPVAMLGIARSAALREVAHEAQARLQRVIASLSAPQ